MAKGSDDFNVNKLNGGGSLPSFVDASDALANQKRIITFYHVNSDHYVAFKAFIVAFTETYSSDWASEQVYGRNDPIYMFKNTTRKISLTFKVPAATIGESYENLGRVQKLLQFLYPNYSGLRPRDYTPSTESWNDVEGMAHANTISGAPLVRLQVMNLARKRENGQEDSFKPTALDDEGIPVPSRALAAYLEYDSPTDTRHTLNRAGRNQLDPTMPSLPEDGLLGAIGNVNVNHNLEGEDGVFEQGGGTILPKMIEVTIDFSPIHESHLGWFEDGTFGSDAFPYGAIPDPDYYQAHGYSAAEADAGGTAITDDEELPVGTADAPAEEPDPPPANEAGPSDASVALAAAAEIGYDSPMDFTDPESWQDRRREMKMHYASQLEAGVLNGSSISGELYQEIQDVVNAELEREKRAFYAKPGSSFWEL